MAKNQVGLNARNVTRDRKGRATKILKTEGGIANNFSEIDNRDAGKHLIEDNANVKRSSRGHNYADENGGLTRRQKYYDVRKGLGLVGG